MKTSFKNVIRSKFTHTLCLATSSLFLTTAASAVTFTLDFEGVGNEADILDFYNGGTDSQGNSGTNFGVRFARNSLGIIDRDAGGTGNFANEPTPDTIMFFLTGSDVLNYEPGFDTGFSFFYTSSQPATVMVYDALNATGNLLGTIDLAVNNIANNCSGDTQGGPDDPRGSFCNFDAASLAFEGTAMSIDFAGTVNQVGFDNITFGSVNPVGDSMIPIPAAAWLFGSSLLGLIGLKRTKKA